MFSDAEFIHTILYLVYAPLAASLFFFFVGGIFYSYFADEIDAKSYGKKLLKYGLFAFVTFILVDLSLNYFALRNCVNETMDYEISKAGIFDCYENSVQQRSDFGSDD
jgi:hypothetical protein